jgi:hypothetical protein
MQGLGMHPMNGWSAQKADDGRYLITFDIYDGYDGEQQAIREFDSTTHHVRYINKWAKIMSWMPAD